MDYPVTPAVRLLRENKVEFEPHLYDYVERGGTHHSAEALGVDEHAVVKTLVMETDAKKPLIVLMHGDREVSTKNLARSTRAIWSAAPAPSARGRTCPSTPSGRFLSCRRFTSTAASAASSSPSTRGSCAMSCTRKRSRSPSRRALEASRGTDLTRGHS
jgi:prolyl-tRNA synthetase